MDIQEWNDRLEGAFISDPVAYNAVATILDKENKHKLQSISALRGHTLLSESLQSFLLQTFNELTASDSSTNSSKRTYTLFTFEFTQILRTIRQCEILLHHGYPMASYMLLRNLRDRVLLLCAVGNKLSSYAEIYGIDLNFSGSIDDNEFEEIRKRSFAEEKRIFDVLLRKSQDLGTHKDALIKWDRQFNSEVHLQKVSQAQYLLSPPNQQGGIPLYPVYSEESCAAYVNRSVELGWMVTRLLPLMQSQPNSFSRTWVQKWRILDDSFRISNQAHQTVGKSGLTELSLAVEFFVNHRFDFHPARSSYEQCTD